MALLFKFQKKYWNLFITLKQVVHYHTDQICFLQQVSIRYSSWISTHPLRDKMAAVSQTIFSDIFMNEKFCILIEISLMFVNKGLIDNNPALV